MKKLFLTSAFLILIASSTSISSQSVTSQSVGGGNPRPQVVSSASTSSNIDLPSAIVFVLCALGLM